MGTTGSVSPREGGLHPVLGLAVVVLGVAGMLLLATAAQIAASRGYALGLRPTLMAAELMLIAPALLALALWRRPLAAGLGLGRIGAPLVAVSLCAGAALWAASLGLLEVQSVLWPPSEAFLETFRQLHKALKPRHAADAAVSIAAIALFPATCEEILFRGVVLPSFARWLGATGAVLASALMFGVIHLDFAADGLAFTRIPFAIVVGVGLGLLRVRTGSLVPSILAHAVLNTITFLSVILTGVEMETQAPDVALGAAMLVGGSILTAIALRHAHPSSAPPLAARLAE